MQIIDLTAEHQPLYFMCIEDWSEEIKEAGHHKENWYNKMKDRGLRVKLALDEDGKVGGMIQYVPSEYTAAEGRDLYFICCIWVHGHKKGRGNFQKRGRGKALLQAAEEEVKTQGAKGIAAGGLSLPFGMKAAWFKKQGYQKADKDGLAVLLWKPFAADAVLPKWIRQKKTPEKIPKQVTVTALLNGWCPGLNMAFERAKRACAACGEKAVFREIDTFDRARFAEWGIADALFIDGKSVRTGPPPAYEKIKRRIDQKINKL